MLVRLNWKFLWLGLGALSVMLGAGCSGVNASHSVSPASFLLPGLMQAEPPPPPAHQTTPLAEPGTEPVRS